VVAPPQTSTRSGHSVRFPRRFDDYLPVMRTALAHIPSKERGNPPQVTVDPISHSGSLGDPSPATTDIDENCGSHMASDESTLDSSAPVITDPDCFGIYRVYARKPLCDPLQYRTLNTHCGTGIPQNHGTVHTENRTTPYYHPFSNPSAAAMMVTHHSGTSVQSIQQTTQIAHVLGSLGSDLDPMDLGNFNAALEHKKLDAYLANAPGSVFHHEDGWLESSVRIRLPLDKMKMPESNAAELEVGGVFHRDIIEVISSVYRSDTVQSFNHIPFKQFWKPSEDALPERLYGEIFSSEAMIDIDEEICKSCPSNDSDESDLEAISVPLLLYSDSTHLASFGTASLWPVYLFFGSQSKYVRAMPTSYACHHIAYMPKVCHSQDSYASIY
jgi:hypothetical protein